MEFQPASFNKTMLFLMSKSDSLRQVEIYLRKREWDVHVTSNLKEAIIHVIQKKPSYFFISYDFPNRKALALANALEHQTSVIITGELAKPHTLKGIQDQRSKYKLPPPITGPAIERIINRIIRDLQNQDAEIQDSIRRGTLTKEQENVIKIRSSFMKAGSSDSLSTGVGLSGLLGGLNDDTGPSYTQSMFNNEEDLGYSLNGDSGFGFGSFQGLNESSALFEEAASMLGAEADLENPPELSLQDLAKMSEEDFAKALEALKKKKKSKGQLASPQAEQDFDSLAERLKKEFERHKRSAIARRQRRYQGVDYGGPAGVGPGLRYRHEKSSFDERMTLLEVGTHQAVDKTTIQGGRQVDNQADAILRKASKVACILVESERFQGYLLVAFASDRSVDMNLIEQMKGKLFSFLEDNGESTKDTHTMQIKMTEVAFEDWAYEHAEFLKSSTHEGQEIAVAFFPATTKFAELQEQTKIKKYELSIDELRGDLIVEFDLYIHLERNNKLILYTPQGRTFYTNQKDRLQSKGVSNLYIDQNAKNDLKKYRVQNYLNDKIAEFKKRRPESELS